MKITRTEKHELPAHAVYVGDLGASNTSAEYLHEKGFKLVIQDWDTLVENKCDIVYYVEPEGHHSFAVTTDGMPHNDRYAVYALFPTPRQATEFCLTRKGTQ